MEGSPAEEPQVAPDVGSADSVSDVWMYGSLGMGGPPDGGRVRMGAMSKADRANTFSIGVGGAVVRDGKLLFVKHNYGPMKWQIPGGSVQIDETIDQAVRREVLEETTIHAEPIGIFAVRHRINDKGNNLYTVFLCRTEDEHDPVPDGREVSEAAFLTLDEIRDLDGEVSWRMNAMIAETVLSGTPHTFSDRGDPEQLSRAYRLFA